MPSPKCQMDLPFEAASQVIALTGLCTSSSKLVCLHRENRREEPLCLLVALTTGLAGWFRKQPHTTLNTQEEVGRTVLNGHAASKHWYMVPSKAPPPSPSTLKFQETGGSGAGRRGEPWAHLSLYPLLELLSYKLPSPPPTTHHRPPSPSSCIPQIN